MAKEYALVVQDEYIKQRFLELAPIQMYQRETIFAIQAIQANELLQKCDPASIKTAIINIALTGATLNPALQQAFLIPRKGKCCLDFSYRGLCKIAIDSGSVYDIDAVAVFEGDEFYYELGLNPVLIHKPKMAESEDEKRKVVAAYSIAILHHGIKKFVVLDREKIARARKSSQTDKVWKEHPDEMAKKTAVKLIYKLLPQTEKMSEAVAVLNEHEGIERPSKAAAVMERFGMKAEEEENGQQGDTDRENGSGPGPQIDEGGRASNLFQDGDGGEVPGQKRREAAKK